MKKFFFQNTAARIFFLLVLLSLHASDDAPAAVQDIVVAWGWDNYGQSTVPMDLVGPVAITAGFYHSLALTGDGRVVP